MAGITTSDDRPKRGKSERRAKKKKKKEKKENDRERKRQKNPECTDSLDRSSKGYYSTVFLYLFTFILFHTYSYFPFPG